MYCDLCIRTSEHQKALEMASKLNLDMIGLIVPLSELPELRKIQKDMDWRRKPRLAIGTDASSGKAHEMIKLVRRARKSADIIMVSGGTDELNRAAVETPEVDILMNHEVQGRAGINHILAKLAKENNVHIAFDYNQLVTSYRLGRVQGFSSLVATAKAVRKYGSPFVITSGAMDPWGMRSGSELMALGRQLGFTEGHTAKGLSYAMVKENRKRLSGKWVMPGVEVEQE
jgi:ribonuclease P/MRP protein subunit RPP1